MTTEQASKQGGGWEPTAEELAALFAGHGMVTTSDRMQPLLRRAWKSAQVSDIALLIEGETGTGKRVLAECIHQLDRKRCRNRFVTVHCGTIPENLAESELFGHHRGAFSGAVGDRKGLFQSAHQGTLFLDDVNDLPLSIQPKVLDVLQRGAIRAVGSDQEVRLDVRVIAACNRPLQDLVRQNLFRADLYYRLDVIHLALPPLRDRLEDLAGLLLAIARRRTDLYQPLEAVELELVEHLRSQSFPGNIRELEHAVERALFLKSSGVTLTLDDWRKQEDEQHEAAPDGDAISEAAASLWQGVSQRGCSYSQLLKELERRVIEKALSAGGRTRRDIASLLCISERKLYQKIRAHRLAVTAQETANSRSTTAQTNTPPHSLTQAV